MMTVWTFFGAGDGVAPGPADGVPPAGAGAVLWAGGHIDPAGAAGAVLVCTGAGGGDEAGAGKAVPPDASAAPCAALGTPAWPEFGSGKIGIVDTTRGAEFAGAGTSTGCSSRETSFSPDVALASA